MTPSHPLLAVSSILFHDVIPWQTLGPMCSQWCPLQGAFRLRTAEAVGTASDEDSMGVGLDHGRRLWGECA
jgi:hypothetical protein